MSYSNDHKSNESKNKPTFEDYRRWVLKDANDRIVNGAEKPILENDQISSDLSALVENSIKHNYENDFSVLRTSMDLIGQIRQLRWAVNPGTFERSPYSDQEERVADYLKEIGGGMDPVGFLIASHAFLAHEMHGARAKIAELEKLTKDDLNPVLISDEPKFN